MQTSNLRKPPATSLVDEMTAEIHEHIDRAGIKKLDANELTARKQRAKAHILARKRRPFDPQRIRSTGDLLRASKRPKLAPLR